MKDSKALKAAHILKKYCKNQRSDCDKCIFKINDIDVCVIEFRPCNYNLNKIDHEIYRQTGGVEDDKH